MILNGLIDPSQLRQYPFVLYVLNYTLTCLPPKEPNWENELTDHELELLSRISHHKSRWEYGLSRMLLRRVCSHFTGIPGKFVQINTDSSGKPRLACPKKGMAAWRFNLSHCSDYIVLAITCQGEIGADVEKVQEIDNMQAVAKKCFDSDEWEQWIQLPDHRKSEAFFHMWTVKEACSKVTGTGVASLCRFHVSLDQSGITNGIYWLSTQVSAVHRAAIALFPDKQISNLNRFKLYCVDLENFIYD